MKFFDGCRPSVYFHRARLYKDAKTERRLWGMTLVMTLKPDEVLQCDDVLQHAYETIETHEDAVMDLRLAVDVLNQQVRFYALPADEEPVFTMAPCNLTGLRMTRVEEQSELWLTVEQELTPGLHRFVERYIFTRFWASFRPEQMSLGDAVVDRFIDAAAGLTAPIGKGGITSVTLSSGGRSVTLGPEDAKRLRARAKKSSKT